MPQIQPTFWLCLFILILASFFTWASKHHFMNK